MRKLWQHYTRQEMALVKKAVARYRAGELVANLAQELAGQLPGRSVKGLARVMYLVAAGTRKSAGRTASKPRRNLSENGRKALQENGRRKWEAVRERLRGFGLTEDQIRAAFSMRQYRLTKEQVKQIEAEVNGSSPAVFAFFQAEGGTVRMEKFVPDKSEPGRDALTVNGTAKETGQGLVFPAANR